MEQQEDQPNLKIKLPLQGSGNHFSESEPATKRLQVNEHAFIAVTKAAHNESESAGKTILDSKGSCSELESISDDCLRYIYQYLGIMDVVNLSVTSTRMLDFAKAVAFLKKARSLRLEIKAGMSAPMPWNLSAPLINSIYSWESDDPFNNANTYDSKLTKESVVAAFRYFGEFVEDLSIYSFCKDLSEDWCAIKIVLKNCKYLKKLRFCCGCGLNLKSFEVKALQDQIAMLHNLKELDLYGGGFTKYWPAPAALKGFPSVDKLSLTATDEITAHFGRYFQNISSLTIDLDHCQWDQDDFAMIFDQVGSSLDYLKIFHANDYIDFQQSLAMLITMRLPKLKSLAYVDRTETDDGTEFLIELPQLKFLRIRLNCESTNSILQTLSNNGVIEFLQIQEGRYDEDFKAPELPLHSLQTLILTEFIGISKLLKVLTTSEMPALHSFVSFIEMEDIYDFLRFVESKNRLKTIHIFIEEEVQRQSKFLERIIAILRKPCSPERPFLNLTMYKYSGCDEDVSTIYCGRKMYYVPII